MHIVEFLGTEPVTRTLKIMEPASKMVDVMLKAKKSRYQHEFKETIKAANYTPIDSNSVLISWDEVEKEECFEGYLVELKTTDGGFVRKELVDSSATSLAILNLEPCTEYIASVNIFMGMDENKEPIFVGELPKMFEIKTLPDMDSPFTLDSLKANIRTQSIRYL